MPSQYGPREIVVRLAPESRYDPNAHDQLAVEMGAQGQMPEEIAARIGVTVRTLQRWRLQHRTFADAMEKSRTACMAWWMAKGRGGLDRTGFRTAAWIYVMQRRFPEVWSQTAAERDAEALHAAAQIDGTTEAAVQAALAPAQAQDVAPILAPDPLAPPRPVDTIMSEIERLQARIRARDRQSAHAQATEAAEAETDAPRDGEK